MTSMKIADIFDRQIDRPINGVIKADQNDEKSVWQELDEYVITQELDRYMREFLEAYLAPETMGRGADAACRNGVWVSGFFGSGKSHFIKIISYLLENRVAHENGIDRSALEFFREKISDPMFAADVELATRIPTDVVLFNVDSKASSNDERAILKVFIRVFNEKLGFCADYPHIADLERFLDIRGKYDEFKHAFEREAGSPWVAERDAYRFHEESLVAAISQVLGKPLTEAGEWLDKYEKEFEPTPENFAKWVADYLARKGPDHRIVFLADEMGAFIGKNGKMMLNLQTITENLGTQCKGGAWVVVTSQANIEAILGEMKSAVEDDFSKIQGRFKARLSLSGSHADEVIQRRLLGKKDEVKRDLAEVFSASGEILRHQVTFRDNRMTMRSYADEDDFIRHYPFIPYQFQLVQKIFDSSRTHGMTGAHLAKGERSMLDAFQTAAVDNANRTVGALVPLHCFYAAIESFLEDIVRRAINGVLANPSLEAFDAQVLKTLFLIRYVEEVSGNVDNLVTLFLDQIDCDRTGLRKSIDASLRRLESETLVSRNGENFFFLTDEERDVGKEIKAVTLSPGEDTKLLGKLVYDEVLKCVDRSQFRYRAINSDLDIVRFIDGQPLSTPKDKAISLKVLTPLADDYADFTDASVILRSQDEVLVILGNDRDLTRDLLDYLRVDKYAMQKMDGSQTESVKRIIRARQQENVDRSKRLKETVDGLLKEARVYVSGKRYEPKVSNSDGIVQEALDYYVANTFKKMGLLKHLSEDALRDAKVILATVDDTLGLDVVDPNQAAMDEVIDRIGLLERMSKQNVLFDLAEHFSQRPYGWSHKETVLLVVKLFAKGSVDLVVSAEKLIRSSVASEIEGANKWRKVVVLRRKSIDEATLQQARQLAKATFNKMPPDGEDAIADMLRESLGEWQSQLTGWEALAADGTYPGKSAINATRGVVAPLLSHKGSYELIEAFVAVKSELAAVAEDYEDIAGFYKTQKASWDAIRKAVADLSINDKEIEKDDAAGKALAALREILTLDQPYRRIREGSALISTVTEANGKVLDRRRTHALEIVDPLIAKVKDELEQIHASSELRNTSLCDIQNIRKRVESQTSVSAIFMLQTEAREAYDDAFEKIAASVILNQREAELKRKQSVEPVVVGGGGSGGHGGGSGFPGLREDPPKTPAWKAKRVITPAKFAQAGSYLESQNEVDEFLNRLRSALTDAIAKNERVEIR